MFKNLPEEKSKIFDSHILYQNYEKWDRKQSQSKLNLSGKFQEKTDKISRIKIRTRHSRYRSQIDLTKMNQTGRNFIMLPKGKGIRTQTRGE